MHTRRPLLPKYQCIRQNVYKAGVKRKIEKKPWNFECQCVNPLKGCDAYCLNRLCNIECGSNCPIGGLCGNRCLQQEQIACLKVFWTYKKGFGLKLYKSIEAKTFIIELRGEVSDYNLFMKEQELKDTSYAVRLRPDAILNSEKKGNIARFINHSCMPNSKLEKWIVNGEIRLAVYSLRYIDIDEEITIDYHVGGVETIKDKPCYCESVNCRGFI